MGYEGQMRLDRRLVSPVAGLGDVLLSFAEVPGNDRAETSLRDNAYVDTLVASIRGKKNVNESE